MSTMRCIGRREVIRDPGGFWPDAFNATAGCGWTLAETAVAPTRRQALADEATASTGRCPRCGGRVEGGNAGGGSRDQSGSP